jgi:phosphatidylglycerophosphate synthase
MTASPDPSPEPSAEPHNRAVQGPDYALSLGHFPATALLTAAITGLLSMHFGLGAAPTVAALALFAGLIALVVATTKLPRGDLGAGTRVTLARIALLCLVGGMVTVPPAGFSDPLVWTLIPIAAVAALLDALDGSIARSTGTVSSFGARLDMEADALFILILSVLLWRTGKIDAWVVAIGAMRYALLAAMPVWPALRRPLPASRRRQTVCVVQVVVLIAALVPPAPPLAASLLAATALALLVWSFAIDIVWLARHSRDAAAGETLSPP